MLHTFYNIRKTLDSSGFPVILPNPNRITTDEAPDESQALLFYTRQAIQKGGLVTFHIYDETLNEKSITLQKIMVRRMS